VNICDDECFSLFYPVWPAELKPCSSTNGIYWHLLPHRPISSRCLTQAIMSANVDLFALFIRFSLMLIASQWLLQEITLKQCLLLIRFGYIYQLPFYQLSHYAPLSSTNRLSLDQALPSIYPYTRHKLLALSFVSFVLMISDIYPSTIYLPCGCVFCAYIARSLSYNVHNTRM